MEVTDETTFDHMCIEESSRNINDGGDVPLQTRRIRSVHCEDFCSVDSCMYGGYSSLLD